jgi:hypothetical protein
MAYNVRYRVSYKRHSGSTTTIDILEKDTSVGTFTPLTADVDPLEIMIDGDPTNVYCGTVGSGANINVRTTPLSMLNVFAVDPQQFMVNIYNGVSGSTLVWQGFINTGIYYEELNINKNTLLSLKANDGMAVLDMIPYRPDPSTYYQGMTYIGNVFNNVLSKLNLTFTDRWGLMDYRVSDYVNDILLYIEVNQNNYIDENGIPMSCREVLNSIMNAFGLRMSFRGSTIYIIDPIILHNTAKGQYFNSGWGATTTAFPGGYLDISLNQIKWYQTGVTLDIIPPINQLEINYDPYTYTGTTYDLSNSNSWSNTGSWTGPLGSLGPNRYYINNSIQYKNVVTDGSILQQAIKKEDGTSQEYYFKLQKRTGDNTGNPGIARVNFPLTNVFKDASIRLKVSADYYVNTRGFDNIYDTSTAPYTINYIDTSIGYMFGGGPDSSIQWQNIRIQSDYTIGYGSTTSQIQDNWYTSTFSWPYGSISTIYGDGSLNVFIWGKYDTGWYSTTDKNVLVKNISAQITNTNGDVISNTGQKTTMLEPINNYIVKPNEIKLTNSTGTYGSSKGAFRNFNTGYPLTGIYRGLDPSTGTLYPTQYHIGQSYVSQYYVPRLVLNGDLNVSAYLLDIQNHLIKWSNYLPNKAFFIVNGTYNDRYEYMSVQMVECTSTRDILS